MLHSARYNMRETSAAHKRVSVSPILPVLHASAVGRLPFTHTGMRQPTVVPVREAMFVRQILLVMWLYAPSGGSVIAA